MLVGNQWILLSFLIWDRSECTATLSSSALYSHCPLQKVPVYSATSRSSCGKDHPSLDASCANFPCIRYCCFYCHISHNSFSRLAIPHQWNTLLLKLRSNARVKVWAVFTGAWRQNTTGSSWGCNKTIHSHGDNIPDSKVRQVWCRPISSNLIPVQDSKRISTWNHTLPIISLYTVTTCFQNLFSKKILRIYFDLGIPGICSRSLLQFSKTNSAAWFIYMYIYISAHIGIPSFARSPSGWSYQ